MSVVSDVAAYAGPGLRHCLPEVARILRAAGVTVTDPR